VARTNIDALDVKAINTAERTIGVSPEGSIFLACASVFGFRSCWS
jgi:hypothetical protein